jgi:hypothetical protein
MAGSGQVPLNCKRFGGMKGLNAALARKRGS